MPALIIVISAVIGDSMIIRKSFKEIVSKAAYAALVLAVTQARNSFVNFMAVWGKLAIFRKKRKSSIITDGNLVSSGANKGDKSGSRHIIGGEKDIKGRKACETKARSNNNKIRE
jgi:hypothetical protein